MRELTDIQLKISKSEKLKRSSLKNADRLTGEKRDFWMRLVDKYQIEIDNLKSEYEERYNRSTHSGDKPQAAI